MSRRSNRCDIAASRHHTCAVLQSDAVRCWGFEEYGALGYGNLRCWGGKYMRLRVPETPAAAQ